MTGRALLPALLAAYLAALGSIGLWQTAVDAPVAPQLKELLARMQESGAPAWIRYGVVEAGANVLLFVPIGVLLVLLLRRVPLAVLCAAALSLALETAQLLFLSQRTGSLRDILCNSLGAAVGAVAAVVIRYAQQKNLFHRISPDRFPIGGNRND